MPRRIVYYDYTHPALHPQAWTVTVSTLGGLLLVIFLWRARRGSTFSRAVHAGARAPPGRSTALRCGWR